MFSYVYKTYRHIRLLTLRESHVVAVFPSELLVTISSCKSRDAQLNW